MRSRTEAEAATVEQVRSDLAEATVRAPMPGRWHVTTRRLYSSTTVTDLPGGSVLVTGNVSAMLFNGFYDRKLEENDPQEFLIRKLRWVSQSDGDYIARKLDDASRAMAFNEAEEVAEYDINEWIETTIHDLDDDEQAAIRLGAKPTNKRVAATVDAYNTALRMLRDGDPIAEVREHLVEAVPDAWEWVGDIGKTLSHSFLYAREACAVVHQYLVAQRERRRPLDDGMLAAEAALVRSLRQRYVTRPRYNGNTPDLVGTAERLKLVGFARALRAIRRARAA